MRHVSSIPSQTLSRTERASATSTSWNTVTIPWSWAARGVLRACTASPAISMVPASGAWTPLRILTRVLLPEPFSPTRAWTSPARRSKELYAKRVRGPEGLRKVREPHEHRGLTGAAGGWREVAGGHRATRRAFRSEATEVPRSGCPANRLPPPAAGAAGVLRSPTSNRIANSRRYVMTCRGRLQEYDGPPAVVRSASRRLMVTERRPRTAQRAVVRCVGCRTPLTRDGRTRARLCAGAAILGDCRSRQGHVPRSVSSSLLVRRR